MKIEYSYAYCDLWFSKSAVHTATLRNYMFIRIVTIAWTAEITMFMVPLGSKIAPSFAIADRIAMSKTPSWCSGLITPVIFKKQTMTNRQATIHGRQMTKDTR